MSTEHVHYVDHAVRNHHGLTEFKCRCHKILVVVDENEANPQCEGFEAFAARINKMRMN